MSTYHIPVMLSEVIDYLNIIPGEWYVDCNLGGGGHTERIFKKGGKVLGIDLDPDAISEVANKNNLSIEKRGTSLFAHSDNLILYQSNFANLTQVLKDISIDHVSGVLFDLGVSSHQLEVSERGFSFNTDAPLDMRMDKSSGVTAADLVNALYEKELAELFWKLGEEHFSRPIARRIAEYRQKKKIETTNELAKIILSVRKRSDSDRTHPATRIFQALRIAVNDELNSLNTALPQATDILVSGGRVVVISFHSLEDRIVKDFFTEQSEKTLKIITKKPIIPTHCEIERNPRSRSGKLRVAEKI